VAARDDADAGRPLRSGEPAAVKGPALLLFDLSRGPNVFPRKIPLTELGAGWPVQPTGMAFSPDLHDKRIAVLFEQGGTGALMTFRFTDNWRKITTKLYPPMPVSAPPRWEDSAITWVSKDALLMYGQLVVDSNTGEQIGDLGVSNPQSQHFTPPDIAELLVPDARGNRGIMLVKIKPDDIAEGVKLLAPKPH